MTPKEERDAFVRLNLTGIIQTIFVAALIGAFTWFGTRVEELSTNLTRSLEKQETLLYRIDKVEKANELESARLRQLEIQLAREAAK
jgi:hypothetical protein